MDSDPPNVRRVMDRLRAITTFIRAAEFGSISGAARDLGLTPQAASQHVMNLEKWAGVRLFNRTTHKISLTEEGLLFYQHSKPAVDSIEDGLVRLREAVEEPVGTVRVAVPHGITRLVGPLMGPFLEQFPRISVELIGHSKHPDVVQERIDVGIQGGTLPDSSLVARQFASVQLVPCAAPSYLAKYGTPKTMEDLKNHRCIQFRPPETGVTMPWMFHQANEVVAFDVPASLTTNDGDAELQAVLSGAGIGQLATFRIASHVRAKRLKPLLIGYVSEHYALYVYMHRRTSIPKKNRVVADFLFEELRRHPDLQPCELS
jgi:DNA-binding transcriptional LysR family regulator